jgi:hypothetical protein
MPFSARTLETSLLAAIHVVVTTCPALQSGSEPRCQLLPNETPSDIQVRFAHPDVALLLETVMLQGELEDLLGLQGKTVLADKSAYIRIPLTEQFELTLRPVDLGFEGYSEWMTWHEHSDENNNHREIHGSIRASVEVVCKRKGSTFVPLTFTVHKPDLEGVINQALGTIRFHTGRRLAPKFIKGVEL